MIDYFIRAETKEAWQTYATEQGWLVEIEEALVPAQHVRIDEIGPVVVEPAVYENGVQVTPPVMDMWHHVNLRLIAEGDALTPLSSGKAVVTPQDVRAIEAGDEGSTIQVLLAEDIETPIRIWADGMHHAEAPDNG